jgi:hypothetical protein
MENDLDIRTRRQEDPAGVRSMVRRPVPDAVDTSEGGETPAIVWCSPVGPLTGSLGPTEGERGLPAR